MISIARRRISTEDKYEFVDLGLPSGLLWAKCNIGAETETDYGLYFQWGDTDGYVTAGDSTKVFDWEHYKYNNGDKQSKYNSTDKKTVLDLEDDAARVNMGGEWRMPTAQEYQELLDNTTSRWVTNYNGISVKGRVFTSKTNNNKLFFPAAGLSHNTTVNSLGSVCCYWSSSLKTSDRDFSNLMRADKSSIYTSNGPRYNGYSVRGIISA